MLKQLTQFYTHRYVGDTKSHERVLPLVENLRQQPEKGSGEYPEPHFWVKGLTK